MGVEGPESQPTSEGVEGRLRIVGWERGVEGESGVGSVMEEEGEVGREEVVVEEEAVEVAIAVFCYAVAVIRSVYAGFVEMESVGKSRRSGLVGGDETGVWK